MIQDKAKEANLSVSDFIRTAASKVTINRIYNGGEIVQELQFCHNDMRNYNNAISQKLETLLRDFWSLKENAGKVWNGNNGLQAVYYDFLHEAEFIFGNANNKPKDAREKTSGLVSLGLIDDNRRLTEVGERAVLRHG